MSPEHHGLSSPQYHAEPCLLPVRGMHELIVLGPPGLTCATTIETITSWTLTTEIQAMVCNPARLHRHHPSLTLHNRMNQNSNPHPAGNGISKLLSLCRIRSVSCNGGMLHHHWHFHDSVRGRLMTTVITKHDHTDIAMYLEP